MEYPHLSTDHRPHIGKKVSLIDFRKLLAKSFSYTMMNYLKKLVGTKSINTKQCAARLSPRIIPHCDTIFLLETLGMGKNPSQQTNIYSFPSPQKFP